MRVTAFFLAFISAWAATAQQHAFRQITTKHGLAQNQLRAIAQDADGFVWFGTLGGASRYDGVGFVNSSVHDGLPDPQVSAIARAHDGALWLGSGNTIVQVIGRRFVAESLPGTDRGTRVMSLVAAPSGTLYIGTDGAGVLVRDAQGMRPLPGYPQAALNARAMLLLRDGSLLIGHRNGLLRCTDGSCTTIEVGDPEPKLVSALAEAVDGEWWIGTLGAGLYKLSPDGGVLAEYDEENGLLQNNVRCLLPDDKGRLWIGSKLGLNVLEGGRMRTFTVHQGLPNDNIQCALQDREGNIWFGTDGAGALRYLGDRFVTYTVKDGVCSDLVMSVTQDAHGDLWLGTYDNGLCRLDGMAMITTYDGLPNNTIWCGLLASDASLWFGTSDGLARVVNGVVQRPRGDPPLARSRVFALHQDSTGRIWCGTREGLFSFRPGESIIQHNRDDGSALRSVRAIAEAPDGGLYLASDNGLYTYRAERFTRIGPEQGLSDITVLSLERDGVGRMWVGTANGLTCLAPAGLRVIRFGNDFGSNYINFLRSDPSGRIWAGTNNGLYLFEPDSLLANQEAHQHITSSDGLRGLEFNLNAAYRWTKGRMLFGSASGLVLHTVDMDDSDRIADQVPGVRIHGVRSFLQPTDWIGQCDSLTADGLPSGLHLSYQRHHLTFDYSATAFSKPEDVRYRYRIAGFDPDWLPPTDARFASYSNLPHGSYTFEVIAAIGDGPWSDPASIAFRIDPPYWARWWFFVICAIVLAAAAFAVHRVRASRRERREKTRQLLLRSRMLQLEQQALNANMNRHFVFNALNSIQFHINRQDRATASKYLTSFAKLIRKNLDASQSDTTSLAEELERLELYLKLEHMRFKDKFRYTIAVDPEVDTRTARLPAMMLQPYVENSIWHGILPMDRQGHVSITVGLNAPKDHVSVRIEDDGIGVHQSLEAKRGAEGDHISRGIEITKGRADVLRKLDLADIRINGPKERTELNGERQKGTLVIIELPLQLPDKKSVKGLQSAEDDPTFVPL
ncbi:MAG: histidine kinase [Flavobacteriales bacterium]|nr:histidine kinase [Flavobacteriales bacterium]